MGRAARISSIALLERGIAQDGGRWEYMHDIGFIYYWWLKDYTKAAEWFDARGQGAGRAGRGWRRWRRRRSRWAAIGSRRGRCGGS